jgi:DNA-binding MarR family transcriptional regulator
MVNQDPQVGYVLKQAQSLLRLRMEQALDPLDLTVTLYSCLHHLHQAPGISAAELARRIFVTRQSMGAILQQLLDRGLVDRPAVADGGRALPTRLTSLGDLLLDDAQARVDEVERRMLSLLDAPQQDALAKGLVACVTALAD